MKSHPISKRQFLIRAATATAAVAAWEPLLSIAGGSTSPQWRLDLAGPWQVRKEPGEDFFPASVPGCIHTDLLASGKIPDPFYRDNEKAVQWVGEANWVYRRTFSVLGSVLGADRVLLRCEGLDTFATLLINGREVGNANNMFRTWEFDAKPSLRPGENTIEVRFTSPMPYIREKQVKRVLYEWAGEQEPKGRAWVRKEPCNFGWDWGPVLVTCGIWRDISLVAFNHARLEDVSILQHHSTGAVELEVQVLGQVVSPGPLTAAISVSYQGKTLASRKTALQDGRAAASITIQRPELWWPAGMGKQPLYEVSVRLLDQKGTLLDRTSRRIGLRTLKVLGPDKENPLRLEVNGVSFFAKGANWIPADAFANRVTPEILRRYVEDAVAVNMNTLRFWGGGYYEEEALFDACDELGVCVWLDFKFGCSSYPAFDEAFMHSVQQEAGDNLRRLRHHPCIALWCGNNEIGLMIKDEWSASSMGRADYDKLFKKLLAEQVNLLAPQANYVSGSPDCGDTHYWQVWHGGKTFDAYRSFTGFPSEFGFQSFPEPKTVRAYTSEADRTSVVTPVMQWHQRSPKGNEKIRDMIPNYFNPPKDFDNALWLSQILQAYGIKIGAEYWRQTMPKSMACVYWQYNDCWPVASWSSVDYFGRWKALHYLARRFYAPLLVSGLEDPKTNTIDVFVTSDRLAPCLGRVTCTITDLNGSVLENTSALVDIAPRTSQKVKTLNLSQPAQTAGASNLLCWLKLSVDGKTVSENLVSLAPPKEMKLLNPNLTAAAAKGYNGFRVAIHADKPALWVWLELDGEDARYSDNFVHLPAGASASILVRPKRRLSQAEFERALRVRSLVDTYA